jgi:Na+-translocating ferredoxin:NAD+ oxidoreductase RnfG subunit
MANFFKSTWFKCVAVLLCIILFSGVSISVLSDLLFVSPDERTDRALMKIYGQTPDTYYKELDIDEGHTAIPYDFGQIEKIFYVNKVDATDTEYDVLFKTTGKEGYKGGTVSMWIKVTVNGQDRDIDKVIIDGNTKQTLMSKLGDAFLGGFYIDISNNYDTYFTARTKDEGAKNPVSGATMSAMAGCNAVNCVIEYMKGVI